MYNIKRGDIWSVDLGDGKGSEQKGVRPCLIIQNDLGNKHAPTTIVLPLTTSKKKFDATHVEVELNGKRSYILCEQVRTVDKNRLKEYISYLDNVRMLEVNEKLSLTQGL